MKTFNQLSIMKSLRPSRFISTLTSAVVLVLLCLAPAAFAQLPNAWQINDNSTGNALNYTANLPLGLPLAATNAGFVFSVNARFVTDYAQGNQTMVMIYGDGTTRWEILWSLNSSDDLVSELYGDGNTTYPVTANGTGTALYHTYQISYNPTNQMASFSVDGQVLTTNWTGSTQAWTAGEVAWGAGSSTGEGEMNFHSVSFSVTNGVVSAYNAGTENDPTNAPDPVTQGWSLSPASPPAGTSTNAISPDRGPDVVTTLADSGYGSLRQTIADARPGDTITFATNGTITLNTGLLISQSLTIAGPGPTNLVVNGNGQHYSVFNLNSNTNTSDNIFGLTIENGIGGKGGGILNNNTLVVSNCVITGNTTLNAGAGGGVYNAGVLTMIACTVSTNAAGNGGAGSPGADGTTLSDDGSPGGNGGSGGNGGGVYNDGVLTLSTCTVINNTAGTGGHGGTGGQGIQSGTSGSGGNGGSGGSGGSGGGLYNNGALVLSDCTMSGNSAGHGGTGGDGGSTGTLASTEMAALVAMEGAAATADSISAHLPADLT
jgi:hypothetical protein